MKETIGQFILYGTLIYAGLGLLIVIPAHDYSKESGKKLHKIVITVSILISLGIVLI